ncbi:hypothetical protein SH2C18_44800 [Clostridium sediminicola]|uniref:hypothetical protein n=1 Tax=Clostridium sediminicola TaxID=3114879 RepID=UPI0031F255A1
MVLVCTIIISSVFPVSAMETTNDFNIGDKITIGRYGDKIISAEEIPDHIIPQKFSSLEEAEKILDKHNKEIEENNQKIKEIKAARLSYQVESNKE